MAKGRPKAGEDKPAPVQGKDERVVIAHIKGSPEYAAWLEDVHLKTRIPKAAIFRLAVEEWSKRNGHPAPPEM